MNHRHISDLYVVSDRSITDNIDLLEKTLVSSLASVAEGLLLLLSCLHTSSLLTHLSELYTAPRGAPPRARHPCFDTVNGCRRERRRAVKGH